MHPFWHNMTSWAETPHGSPRSFLSTAIIIVKIAVVMVVIILIVIIKIIIIMAIIIIIVIRITITVIMKITIVLKLMKIVVQSYNPKTYLCSNSDNAQREV